MNRITLNKIFYLPISNIATLISSHSLAEVMFQMFSFTQKPSKSQR